MVAVGTAAGQTLPSTRGFHASMIARAASILGVPETALDGALGQAHDQALDDAVKAGRMTQQQADFMKQRHASIRANGGPGMMGGRFGGPQTR